jgi:tape measure domain-containing protein
MVQLERIARLPGLGFREIISGANQLNVAFSDLPNTLGRTNRTLAAFGRAVGLTGGGPAEFQRVITQVTQIASAGKLLQQDLRPIIQTAPAVGQALKAAFGTISPQEIEALGLSTEQFLDQLVVALEALPAPAETVANSLENLKDSAFRASAAMGEIFLPSIQAGATFLADELERLVGEIERTRELSGQTNARAVAIRETGMLPISTRRDMPDVQVLPGRAQPIGDVEAMRRQMAVMDEQAAELRELAAEYANAQFQAEQLDHRIKLLNDTVAESSIKIKEARDIAPAWAQSLEKLDLSSLSLDLVTADLNHTLDSNATKANHARVAILGLAEALKEANEAASGGLGIFGKIGSALGRFGSLASIAGLAIPGIGQIAGISSILGSFAGGFAEGGYIPSGQWGIVGERGPEVVRGPASVSPGAMPQINVPPARDPMSFARDQQWVRAIVEAFRTAEEGGFRPQPA